MIANYLVYLRIIELKQTSVLILNHIWSTVDQIGAGSNFVDRSNSTYN